MSVVVHFVHTPNNVKRIKWGVPTRPHLKGIIQSFGAIDVLPPIRATRSLLARGAHYRGLAHGEQENSYPGGG